MSKKNILVIAAHPDDEILGCGGTIIKLKKSFNLYTLILGAGIDSRGIKKNNQLKKTKLIEQGLKANKYLGVKEIYFENLKDNSFDNYDLLEIIKIIEKYINKIKPNIIFTHSNNDLNIDHRIIFQSTLTACRPQRNSSVKKLYSYEVPSSTEWSFGRVTKNFQPNFFVDIEKNIKKKIKSLQFYKSEMRKFPHPRSIKNIQNISSVRGSSVGLKNAESFECIFDIS